MKILLLIFFIINGANASILPPLFTLDVEPINIIAGLMIVFLAVYWSADKMLGMIVRSDTWDETKSLSRNYDDYMKTSHTKDNSHLTERYSDKSLDKPKILTKYDAPIITSIEKFDEEALSSKIDDYWEAWSTDNIDDFNRENDTDFDDFNYSGLYK